MTDPTHHPDPKHPGRILFAHRDAQRAAQRAAAQQARPTTPHPTPMPEGRVTRYAQRALAEELATLAATTEGARNDQLNIAAFNLGQLVAAGALSEQDTRAALRHAALTAGLEPGEVDRTIGSGLPAGMQHPRNLTVAADPPAPAEAPTPAQVDQFWNARPLLAHLHATARARRVSPWAVLGVTLARVATATPPLVVLPPIVGGQASLNTFIGLVGKSGSGKGAAERVAADALHVGHLTTMQTGSGEGLVHAYRRRQRDGTQVPVNDAVLFSVPEIDTLSALGSRQGATLMPVLRNAWSGEALGFAYADPSRRLEVEPHTYRLCLVAGIQPARAQALLDEADGGTPQRFLWMPATDRHAPDTPPPCPPPMTWEAPNFNRADLRHPHSHGRMEMRVCAVARDTIDAAHLARTRGEGDALDGHLLLTQLKAAATLAIADARLEVSDEDWALADVLTRWSTSVRAGIAEALAGAAKAKNDARADAEADRAVRVADKQAEAQVKRVARSIVRHLNDGEVVARKALRHRLAARDRAVFDEAVDLLVRSGQVVVEQDGTATRYHRA